MKTRAMAASAIIALIIAGAVSVTFAHSGLTITSLNMGHLEGGSEGGDDQNKQTTTQHDGDGGGSDDGDNNRGQASMAPLTVGHTITFSNLTGHFINISNHTLEGSATGSLNVMVTGVLREGVTLSIVSGHFALANTTSFTITGGSMVLTPDNESASGSGTAGTARFIIQVDNVQRSSSSSEAAAISLDIKNGTSEFLVSLGTQPQQGDDSGDSSGDSGE